MKGYKFWEQDLTSYIDTLLSLQHPEGFFYEMLMPPENEHLTFVKPKHRLVDRDNHIGWVRLELEADVEYLMVEGAWTIWQATGDRRAMEARLPGLERTLKYCFTDPTRWDAKHGALKRPFTPDTWDFTYGKTSDTSLMVCKSGRRWIKPRERTARFCFRSGRHLNHNSTLETISRSTSRTSVLSA